MPVVDAPPADLPRLILLADRFTQSARAEQILKAVAAGVGWIHLRDHKAGDDAFARAALELTQQLDHLAEDVLLTINTHLALARTMKAGLHVGRRGPSVEEARHTLGPHPLLGYSAHTLEEATRAARTGADYLFFSPVFATSSKPGHPGAGLEALQQVCHAVPKTPVFALGGLTPERVAACRHAGAYGVAVLSGIMDAPRPEQATMDYLTMLLSV